MSGLEPIGAGEVRLYDRYAPGLLPGEYEIEVTQELAGIAPQMEAKQRFRVGAPRVSLDPSEVVQTYPPDGLVGEYADTLPFVLLAEPTLPWERAMAEKERPWLALLVLGADELLDPGTAPGGATTTTVSEFLALPGTLVPQLPPEPEFDESQPCNHVKISAVDFQALLPRAEELGYLAHVRQSGPVEGASAGKGDLVAVVVANRFPAVGPEGPVKSVVHLVALEGLEPYLVADPVFTRSGKDDGTTPFDSVALLSLAAWSFQSLPDPVESFEGLATDLLESEYDPATAKHAPERLWLSLSPPNPPGQGEAATTVAERIAAGYVPLEFHSRTGEEMFAWYRGPLTPQLPAVLAKPEPFLSADAALAYDPASGTFDASLAAAWQIGRSVALADRAFGATLLDLRRKLHLLADRLYDRLARDEFASVADLAALAHEGRLSGRLLEVLSADLVAELRGGPGPTPPPSAVPGAPPDAPTDLRDFLADDAVQAAVLELVADDLDPVAQWLARLSLLGPLPFANLVPDPRMLPAQTPAVALAADGSERMLAGAIRFFYVDPNWTGALLDGALSIGLESSLQTFFHSITAGLLQGAAAEAARQLRAATSGVAPPPGPSGEDVLCGLLLRSPLVSGWPGLTLRPLDSSEKPLRVLRLDRLAPGVMIGIFDGVPASVAVAEPQVGLRLGVDPKGAAELRQPGPGGDPGVELGETLAVRDPSGAKQLLMRAAGSRVLDVAPAGGGGLVPGLLEALEKAGHPVSAPSFGSAALALQLVDAPLELTFQSGASQ